MIAEKKYNMSEAAKKKTIGMDFTEGAIMPLLLRFFLPFLAANILNSLYNTVDTIIIGQFVGSAGIVSVNMGGKMLNMFTQFGVAFAGGGQVLISQLIGAKQKDKVKSTIGTLFVVMAVMAVLCTTLMMIFGVPILKILNTPEESFAGALSYLRITAIGLILMFGYNAVSSILADRRYYIYCGISSGRYRYSYCHCARAGSVAGYFYYLPVQKKRDIRI